jgi:phosphohistidine phosphatase
MPRLLLIRHAKSSWDVSGRPDRDRPLNPRGRRDAPRLAAWLRDEGLVPDIGLVSPAARTKETWSALLDGFGREVPARFVEELYQGEADAILGMLRDAAPAETVAVVAHNPAIGDAAALLAEDPPDDPRFWKYPTAATAVFAVPAWDGLDWGTGRLEAFVTPKTLRA